MSPRPDEPNPRFVIGGELPVRRSGFGAMRLPGPDVWGPPADRDAAVAVLRRAVDLGVELVDTADAYGPGVSEELIAEALYPYPDGVVVTTKGGLVRPSPDEWRPDGRPEHLRDACEASLRRLRVGTIDLYQLHSPDPRVPFADSVGALVDLRAAGKIRHIGLSNVSVAQLREAQAITPVATVQNRYNLDDRSSDDVLDVCEAERIGFLPWYPLAAGGLLRRRGALSELAAARGLSTSRIALAWLLARSPVVLPIPGTSSVEHLEDNVAAAGLRLGADEVAALSAQAE